MQPLGHILFISLQEGPPIGGAVRNAMSASKSDLDSKATADALHVFSSIGKQDAYFKHLNKCVRGARGQLAPPGGTNVAQIKVPRDLQIFVKTKFCFISHRLVVLSMLCYVHRIDSKSGGYGGPSG